MPNSAIETDAKERAAHRHGVRRTSDIEMNAASPDDGWARGDAYETFMGRWSRRLAHDFVRWLGAEPGLNWLEVGCGTGALTSTICDLCEPASVLACDPSEPFIEHARRNLSDARAAFLTADADALPYRTGGFDVAVSGLVLNFLPDPGAAVAAIRERLRRGGTVAAYVWDYADGMEFLKFFWEEAVTSDTRAATLDEGRRFPLCREPALDALFRAGGLAQVDTYAVEIPTNFATFEDYWTPFLRGTGPAPSYVASLDPSRRDLLRERLRRRLHLGNDGGVRLRARAWAVRGVAS
jgi:SAM-dependent methyltransferase